MVGAKEEVCPSSLAAAAKPASVPDASVVLVHLDSDRRWLRRRPMQGGTSCWTYSGALSRSGRTTRSSSLMLRRMVRLQLALPHPSALLITSAAASVTRASPVCTCSSYHAWRLFSSLLRMPVWRLPLFECQVQQRQATSLQRRHAEVWPLLRTQRHHHRRISSSGRSRTRT